MRAADEQVREGASESGVPRSNISLSKGFPVKYCLVIVGSVMLALAAAPGMLVAGDKDKVAEEAAKEESDVPYDSKTQGALQVKSINEKTSDWFTVTRDGRDVARNRLLNATVKLAPGTYMVSVNRAERKVTIQVGRKTILLTGELIVEAPKGTPGWYTPYQGKQAMLSANPPLVNSPVDLFAGKYKVVYKAGGVSDPVDLGEAEVKPGRKTIVKR